MNARVKLTQTITAAVDEYLHALLADITARMQEGLSLPASPSLAVAPRAKQPARRRPLVAKRDPEVIQATTEQLLACIKHYPGLRIEEIGKALGMTTRELALPIKKLIAAKRIRTAGQRRSTKYTAI